ncbi:META domain-containing protein [Galbibacter orientalis]|uniref:Heat shock protein n=1 Tax=Galbibacter orientalis DSM 19592 TaxID=926559 RepID=I3C303_9FLAO|nr:META domain-containing protein [Galbibacter orientalis]EIJ37996.1 heat shock protein [Galbibacter orientalis DSM 19592]
MKKIILIGISLLTLTACNDAKKKEEAKTAEENTAKETPMKKEEAIPQGIDFIASGENPSWSLLIDFDKSMTFTSLDNPKKISTPVPEARIPQDVSAVNYSAETEAGLLQVTIFKESCETENGESFSYKVTVSTKTDEMQDYNDFKGCGKYIGDYRLNDIWALETMNGKPVDKSMKRPNLEFNLRSGKVFGFSGCNRINGTLVVEKDSLAIGELMSTKMACPNAELETNFLDAVNNKKFSFTYKNLILTLTSGENNLTFRKVD